jgi:predicted transposase YdaD
MQESVTYRLIQDEARQERDQQIALKMVQEGIALEAIARITGLSMEQIQQLQAAQEQTSEQ